jgi:glutamyl-tRNA reductase
VSLVVVGLNHRTAPIAVLERMAVTATQIPKALHGLALDEHLDEVVLLSTCNRTEIYAHCTRFHPAVQAANDFLSDLSHADPDEFAPQLYTYYDEAAVAHLFGVATGIDSMIVGEGEILGQVKEAWRVAHHEGACGPRLSRVFQHAVEVGKRARTETAIGRHATSVSSAAVALAEARLGSLQSRRILVLGAGEVGEGMAVALSGAGVGDVKVVNRTLARAEDLARRIGGTPIAFEELPDALRDADVLLSSTGSSELVLERSDVESVMHERGDRALLIVDVAVPRDVDPGAGEIFGVMLLDIDDLKAFAEQSIELRRQEIARVRDIVTRELERYRLDKLAREAAPLVAALRARIDSVRRRELDRYRARIDALGPEGAEIADSLTRALVNKVLHGPTVRVKEAAGTARGELLAEALVMLFDLPDDDDTDDDEA